jgi:hypothetical protein
MALPTVTKTWTISPNNRITFVSLLDTMQRYLFGIKEFLKNTGTYTVKGSCSTAVGAMDGADRWTSSALVTPRATATSASNAWFVLTDGNGCDLCLSYVGASDDIARISFSSSGSYVVAGTANNTPTATDEIVILSIGSLIGSTASADRVWNGWVSSDKKLCRFNIARSGIWVGQTWGLELVTSSVSGPPAVFTPAVWGFGAAPAINAWANSTAVGFSRISVASVAFTSSNKYMMEIFGSDVSTFNNVLVEAQGGTGYPVMPLSIGSATTGTQGKIGALIDWWAGRSAGTINDGDTYGTLQFLVISILIGGMWPWDGTTTPVLT